jgi:hypothetical protein
MASDAAIKGEQANQVLANPVFIEAFDSVIDGIVEAIAEAPIDESELRNQLGLQLAAGRVFKELIFEHIETAKLQAEQDAIDEAERKKEENATKA